MVLVSHLGWKLSAAMMMKRINLYVIPFVPSLCKHLHVCAQSTIRLLESRKSLLHPKII